MIDQLGAQPLDLLVGRSLDAQLRLLNDPVEWLLLALGGHGREYVPVLLFEHLHEVLNLNCVLGWRLLQELLLLLLLLPNGHIGGARGRRQESSPAVAALSVRNLLPLLLLTATRALVQRRGFELVVVVVGRTSTRGRPIATGKRLRFIVLLVVWLLIILIGKVRGGSVAIRSVLRWALLHLSIIVQPVVDSVADHVGVAPCQLIGYQHILKGLVQYRVLLKVRSGGQRPLQLVVPRLSRTSSICIILSNIRGVDL